MSDAVEEAKDEPAVAHLPSDLSPAKRALANQRLHASLTRRGGRSGTAEMLSTLAAATSGRPVRLSIAQEQLWYFHRLATGNPVYNEAITFRKEGEFEHAAFVAAFNEILRRHEAWRTTFETVDGLPMQVVRDAVWVDVPIHDLSHLSATEAEAEADRQAAAEAVKPYDLANGPLVRPLLFRISGQHHRLALGLHHLVFDGVTLYRIILPEMAELYNAFARGRRPEISPVKVPYRAYCEWERAWMATPAAQSRLEYWRQHLAGLPVIDLPLDRPRPPVQRYKGFMEPFEIPASVGTRLHSVASDLGATLFQALAATYAIQLHRYGSQPEVVFAAGSDLRQRPELQGVAGYCLTPLVLRCAVSDDDSFRDVVGSMREELADCFGNIVPFAEVVRAVAPVRDPRANPLFQAMFTLEPAMSTADPAWSVHQMEAGMGNTVGHAKFDMMMELDERPDGRMTGRLILNGDVFDPDTGRRLIGHYLRLLNAAVDAPDDPVGRLPMVTDEELIAQVVEWNETAVVFPSLRTDEMIADSCSSSPDVVAISSAGERQLTYAGLDEAAERLADKLRASGTRPGDVVALYCDRSVELPVGLLGIWKAGCAYLPLDPALPPASLSFRMQDAGASVLTVPLAVRNRPDFVSRESALGAEVALVAFEADGAPESHLDRGEPLPAPNGSSSSPDDTAYVMYTSGSSGTPKGVPVSHRALANLLCSFAREPGLDRDDVVLAVTSAAFDIAAVELLLPLCVGARIVIAPEDAVADGARLAQLIAEEAVTFLQATPTTWRLLIEAGLQPSQQLVAVSGGEPLSQELAEAILDRLPVLWNAYGPTETTIWSTFDRCLPGEQVTIGRPVANTQVYVLDSAGRPLPVGSPGELCIAGTGVAGGYVNRAEETAACFVEVPPWLAHYEAPRPDGDPPPRTMYRTGDKVRWLPDGRLQHLGRLDDQVKIRGHRVEPGEIEAACRQLEAVAAAAVVPVAEDGSASRLVAFLVPRTASRGLPPDVELRRQLRALIPDYMIPTTFHALDDLPSNVNGKLDRFVLRQLAAEKGLCGSVAAGARAVRHDAAPRTALEHQLSRIWAEVLGVESVGPDDDFFDLGGYSIRGVALVGAVERALGMDLPLSVIYERGSTVRGMAATIEALQGSGAEAEVAGKGLIFFVMTSDTTLLSLRHLGPVLSPEFKVMGLLAARDGERFDRSKTVEERAAELLTEVRRLQPSGPYYIAGYSLGGLLAYEMGDQLRRKGEEVAWLGLVNTRSPLTASRPPRTAARAARLLALDSRSAGPTLRRLLGGAAPAPGTYPQTGFDAAGAFAVGVRYVPPRNDVTVHLFVSRGDAVDFGITLGWRRSHGGRLVVHSIAGEHRVLFDPANAPALAREIGASIASSALPKAL